MTIAFDRDIAITQVDDMAYEGSVPVEWLVGRGANGGFVAALLLRALANSVDDLARQPRSLTVHYLAPAEPGTVRITTTVERSGRSLTSLSARMTQASRTVALALAAFAAPRESATLTRALPPDVAPLDVALPFPPAGLDVSPFADHYEYRWAFGDLPYSGSCQAHAGGWMRLREPRPLDAALAVAFLDGWIPCVFPTLREPSRSAFSTIDLTYHFRADLPLPGTAPDAFTLGAFYARQAENGFFDENGELWSAGGVLLAQSRQLALLPGT